MERDSYGEVEVYGQVYLDEETGRYYYHCGECCTSFSGPNEYIIDIKAEDHEFEYHNGMRKSYGVTSVSGVAPPKVSYKTEPTDYDG